MEVLYTISAIYVIAGLLAAFAIYKVVKSKYDSRFWAKNGNTNFPVKHRGKTFWHSRSVAVAGFIFAKNENGEWCILANQRGPGCPDYQGYWCCPCGYLDYNETAEQAISRECFEECGIEIEPDKFKMVGVSTNPEDNRQNVTIKFMSICDGNIWEYNLSTTHMEKDEVSSLMFIPLSQAKKYQWAFGHYRIIKEYSSQLPD